MNDARKNENNENEVEMKTVSEVKKQRTHRS